MANLMNDSNKNAIYGLVGIVVIVLLVSVTLNYLSTHPVPVSLDSKLTGMVVSESSNKPVEAPTMAPCGYAYLRHNFSECNK